MYLGRSRRLATPAQITALAVRDGAGCQFPGCTHTRHLHAHHVAHWLYGGRTDTDNLILICSHHHSLIVRHEALVVPNGGERPSSPVRRSGRVKLRAA
jgi:hypothetical protein